MHVVFRESHGLEETDTPTDLGQSPADLVVLSFSAALLIAALPAAAQAPMKMPSAPPGAPEPPPLFQAVARLAEPVMDPRDWLPGLTAEVCAAMAARDQGCRRLRLSVFRVDGERRDVVARCAAPSREAAHLLRLWGDRIEGAEAASHNPKTVLQEWAQAKGMTPPRYEITDRSGPDHAPLFRITVTLDDGRQADASGTGTKRSIEQAAAQALLDSIEGRE